MPVRGTLALLSLINLRPRFRFIVCYCKLLHHQFA